MPHPITCTVCGPCPKAMRISQSVAGDQDRVCKIVSHRHAAVMTSRGERGLRQRRYWEHTIRDDLDCTDGQHASQPSQARSRGAPGGLAVFVVSSVRRRRAISCLGGGAAAMNRNRPANGSESKRRRQGEHKTSSPSGGAPASGCGGMRCAVPPYACCSKSAAKTLPLVESPRTIAGRPPMAKLRPQHPPGALHRCCRNPRGRGAGKSNVVEHSLGNSLQQCLGPIYRRALLI